MRILMLRHGDPDYEHDGLTEQGREEAALLAKWMQTQPVDELYVSPLGRAQQTCAYTTQLLGMPAVTLDWLREFPAQVDVNDSAFLQQAYGDLRKGPDGRYLPHYAWDMRPNAINGKEEYFTEDGWKNSEVAKRSDMEACCRAVWEGLDTLLASCGYVHEGNIFRVEKANHKTIALFCHFGVTCVMLSHLWKVSPFVLWHMTATSASSITELFSEEREEGVAIFRMRHMGGIPHLEMAGKEPSFAARFCETFTDETRH
ncbi:MAG: histidine phosphatase family protein [Lachnospiraceae bacterium]|nr:histidine phosphatase family protein [Lachnospiraceae bacterium]